MLGMIVGAFVVPAWDRLMYWVRSNSCPSHGMFCKTKDKCKTNLEE